MREMKLSGLLSRAWWMRIESVFESGMRPFGLELVGRSSRRTRPVLAIGTEMKLLVEGWLSSISPQDCAVLNE